MSIPLIQDNQKDSINASLIAIKREEERLQALIAEADKKIAQLNELKVNKSDIVDEVTSGNMQSVTSNAVASALEWEDITDSISFTKVTTSGNFTNYTIENVKCFKQKNVVNLSFMYKFGQSLGSSYTTLRTKINSTKFTTRENVSLASSSVFYGNMIGAIRLGEDGDDSNTLITRIPANSNIVTNATITIVIRFPI